MDTSRLRRVLVDSPTSLGGKARKRRWELLRATFPNLENMRVLDLGGTVQAWERAPLSPDLVTVLNLTEPGEPTGPHVVAVTGDACRAVDILTELNLPTTYDLVYSNSLIEHLGGHARRLEFAEQVRALAPRFWVQTPYRYFPIEPHWLFPGMQFLPAAARVKIATHWPLSHTPAESYDDARDEVLWTELISQTELRDCLPESTILHERVLGLTKSLIAVKRS